VNCAACRGDAARTVGAAVPGYRCYFLDSADHVAATDVIECETDACARARADVLLAACDYPGIEVWDRDRKVYRARKSDGPLLSK
jgi:hypothetical protein